MSSKPTHIKESIPDLLQPEKIQEVLDRPFPPELVKTRPGSFGKSLCYVEAHEYIARLNEAFGPMWSFNVVSHEILENEVVVVGKLATHGFVKMAFGGSQITRAKETGDPVSIADDLKSAATDSLKKCASLLGLGLHLYQDNQPKNPAQKISGNGNGQDNGNGKGAGGNSRLTSRQLEAILSIGREKGLDREKVRQLALERFNRNLEFLCKQEASSFITDLQNS